MVDARKWTRETAGRDWVLLKSVETAHAGWLYYWKGPPDTGCRMTCYGTEHSAMFLATLRDALESFRHTLAHHLTEEVDFREAMNYTI